MTRFLAPTLLVILLGAARAPQGFAGEAPAPAAAGGTVESILDARPAFYLSAQDVARLRRQATRPELAQAYANLEQTARKIAGDWRRKYPATSTPRSGADLLAAGRQDPVVRDYKALATAFALHPTAELAQVVREKLLASIGTRQAKGYWRADGIHEGEAAMQFLEAYDLVAHAGVLDAEDHRLITEEMQRCGGFLECWTLGNYLQGAHINHPTLRGLHDYRSIYCLNFQVFATAMIGCIALRFPELPEAKRWLRTAQTDLPRILFSEFATDGGYGEESLHYWHPTFRAILQFMVACRTCGNRDYFADPAVSDQLRRTLGWRMDLTAPDGRGMALGDTDRVALGAEYLLQGGALLGEPGFVWVGRQIIERARTNRIPEEPYDLFFYDLDSIAAPPTTVSANYPESGYGIFRSGWGSQDSYFLLRYGTTWIGRRENEPNLIISGHSHADSLHLELHHQGIPVTVDPGRVGRYQDWDSYGGYCKATVAHNTVGLANPWGYDRLDGQYAQHVKDHGPDFLYEISQDNIGRADTDLRAVGDVGQLAVISARVRTFPQVHHQRTVAWFKDSGVAVVHDRLESDREQTYEWYLNPIGALLHRDQVLTFGDATAHLDVVPVLPAKPRVQILAKGDPQVPPYYVSLRPDGERRGTKPGRPYVVEERWGTYTLLTLQEKAVNTEFLQVLIPYGQTAPLAATPLGSRGTRLTGGTTSLLVAAGKNDDPTLSVDGDLGVVRSEQGQVTSYVLHQGHGLVLGGRPLVTATLVSTGWAPYYDGRITAAVSLKDHRASLSVPITPMDRRLILSGPKVTPGQEPTQPLVVRVTFAVDSAPKRMIALRSRTEAPDLEASRATNPLAELRETLATTYDPAAKTVTVDVDPGIRQIVWE